MTEPYRLTVRMDVDGDVISGVLSDETGRSRPFTGWLELIAAVQAVDGADAPEAPQRPAAE